MSSSTHTNPEGQSNPEGHTVAGRENRRQILRGQLKVFLGYSAGVGKTYRMLEEAQEMKRQGKDIVVGYFEPHDRKDTMAKTVGLEAVPRHTVIYRGTPFLDMDTDAILARRPGTCVVDELAHTNVPGSQRTKRWEDVQVLLDAGIDVITNMNIQHLESLNDQVFHITGVRVRETVPDWFVKGAHEVVMVDVTTGAVLNRLKRGDIYAADKVQKAMANFFKESNLAALRELALRQAAHELESRESASTSEERQQEQAQSSDMAATPQASADRILIFVGADDAAAMLIRRGRRMADYLGADCFAVSVVPKDGKRLREQDRQIVEKHLNFAKNLHIQLTNLEADDAAEAIVDFAQRNQITQILVNRSDCSSWGRLLGTDFVLRVVRKAKDIRVIIVAERARKPQPAAV